MLIKDKIILASQSPRRLSLLNGIGIEVSVMPPNVDETQLSGESPEKFTCRIALNKAKQVLSKLSRSEACWIISADTVVVINNEILSKPKNPEDACRMLRILSGKTHKVVTSFCLLSPSSKKEFVESVETNVTFRKLSVEEIAWYVKSKEPLDKAGAYGAQGLGMIFIERIEGSYSNVVGLPLSRLIIRLQEFGVVEF